jgi:hypothetical protein
MQVLQSQANIITGMADIYSDRNAVKAEDYYRGSQAGTSKPVRLYNLAGF